MQPMVLLAELMALYYGWTLFADGPLAFYVLAGLFIAWRLACIAHERGRDWWPVCGFGAALALMQSTCGMLYAADGRSFVCDSGTGLPISALVLAGGAALTAHYVRRRPRNGSPSS